MQLPAVMSWLVSRTASHHAPTVAGVLVLGSYTGKRPAVYPFFVARCTALSAVFMLVRGTGMCFSPSGGRREDSEDSNGERNRAGGRFVLSLRTILAVRYSTVAAGRGVYPQSRFTRFPTPRVSQIAFFHPPSLLKQKNTMRHVKQHKQQFRKRRTGAR